MDSPQLPRKLLDVSLGQTAITKSEVQKQKQQRRGGKRGLQWIQLILGQGLNHFGGNATCGHSDD